MKLPATLTRLRIRMAAALTLVAAAHLAGSGLAEQRVPVPRDPAQIGEWSAVQNWPAIAVHAHLLPTGHVMFSSYSDDARTWDPATDLFTPLPQAGFNLFCGGHAFLPDGRLLAAGGHIRNGVGVPNASAYDPAANRWTALPNMNEGRWYPSARSLATGEVLVIAGTKDENFTNNRLPQVWTGFGWRDLTGAARDIPAYPAITAAPNGQVFLAGPGRSTEYLDTSGTGMWTPVANRQVPWRGGGAFVMYDEGKVLFAGGGDPPTPTAEVIDLNAASPAWRSVTSMSVGRQQMNLTLLPDGRVLATGGTSGPGFNDRNTPVRVAEMWDPATERWTAMASMAAPRWYHSTALLLPDGRVLSAGGDDHATAEYYSPPYLFRGARPVITAAPAQADLGQTFLVRTPDAGAVAAVHCLKLGSVTHSLNNEQQLVRMSFTPVAGGVNVTSPSDARRAPPGYYMLFLLNGQGVPSVARMIRLTGQPLTFSVSGRITENGQPLEGIPVLAGARSAVTDADGRYTVAGLIAGSYSVRPASPFYTTTPPERAVTVGPDQTGVDFQARRLDFFTISGRVTENGRGVAGVTVTAGNQTATTSVTGAYALTQSTGAHQVVPARAGTRFVPASAQVRLGPDARADFVATPNGTFVISGRVTLAGLGFAGVVVTAGGTAVATAPDGTYTLSGLPQGSHRVTATRAGFAFDPPERSVQVGPDRADVDFSGDAAYSVSGTVRLEGVGLAGVAVTAAGRVTTTSAAGAYTLRDLPAGTHVLVPSRSGFGFTPAQAAVALVETDVAGVDFSAIRTGFRISGTVRENGAPLAGVTVAAGGQSALTGSDGAFSLNVANAGTYTVTPSRAGYTFMPPQHSVSVGPDRAGVDFAAVHGFTVRGTVTRGGAPLAGVAVSAGGRGTTTRIDGTYALEGLPPGAHVVTPDGVGYRFDPASRMVTLGPDQAGVDFTAADSPTLVELTVTPAAIRGGRSASGTVRLSAPAPAGAALAVTSSDPAAIPPAAGVRIARGKTTARFKIRTRRAAGPVTVTLESRYGGVTRRAEIRILP